MTDTQQLLRAYVESDSEAAFREIVGRYINLVYSTAIRLVDNQSQLAEDIVQTVFTDLAGKASSLPPDVQLGGWLHRHTCFVASNAIRSERRRLARERQAAEMSSLENESNWGELAPVVDDAINQLTEDDRQAILLRFFEKCDFRSVGAALGVSDDAAQKRVSRALEKLRTLLIQRGVAFSAATLGTVLTDRALATAPPRLIAAVSEIPAPGKTSSRINSIRDKATSTSRFAVFGIALVTLLLPIAALQFFKPGPRATAAATRSNGISDVQSSDASAVQSGSLGTEGTKDANTADASVAAPRDIATGESGSELRLTIVAADSGKPVPNVPIDLRIGVGGDFQPKRQLVSDRVGFCNIPIHTPIDVLQLVTRKDGFADTRLEWWPSRGDLIPGSYTLRLERPIKISGRVLDTADQPIEGASVFFMCNPDLSLRKGPESHDFTWVKTKTDAQGHWELNRIAAGAWNRASGYAEHTNYVTEHLGHTMTAEAQQQMLAGTHIFRLKQPVTVKGVVVDSSDQPVGDAKVVINGDDDQSTRSDLDGAFLVPGCKPGRTRISVEAGGFASATIETNFTPTSTPVRIVLDQGKSLRIRIVDKAGQPVTNATAQLRMIKRPSGTYDFAVYKQFEPDAEGRVVWNGAPKEEMLFSVYARKYGEEAFFARAGAPEHLVTLSPATVVRGAVRNDRGELIPRFRVAVGHPEVTEHATNYHWGLNPSQWLNFAGGKYEHAFEHWDSLNLSFNAKNPGYVLKFEADDHASFISRRIRPDEGDVELNVTLPQAEALRIQVFSPTGKIARGAEIALHSTGMSQIGVASGKFSGVVQGGRLRSDQRGEFRLPADQSIEKIVVVHPEGYAEVTPAELASRNVIDLQVWGNIEGTLFSKGKPVSGTGVYAVPLSEQVYLDTHLTTDGKGRFHFQTVPPGEYIVRWRMPTAGQSAESSFAFSKRVVVEPGQTATVEIGGSGYAVTARLRWPDGLQRNGEMRIHGAITAPLPETTPDDLAAAFAAKPESTIYFGLGFDRESKLVVAPEIRSALLQANHLTFEASADGSFIAEGVEPGRGLVTFIVVDKAQSERQRKMVIAAAAATVIVLPSDQPAGTVDIGEIALAVPLTQ